LQKAEVGIVQYFLPVCLKLRILPKFSGTEFLQWVLINDPTFSSKSWTVVTASLSYHRPISTLPVMSELRGYTSYALQSIWQIIELAQHLYVEMF